jgi:diacylglycerol kinase (ATP)
LSLFVVFNPRSGKGRGAQLVGPVLDKLSRSGPVEHAVTTKAGEEERLAAEAAARGVDTVVAVGGDGTWSNVANGILRSGRPTRLGLIPGGTGCDLAKSLGIPRDPAGAAEVVLGGRARRIDAGRIEERYFLNIVGFGYDVAVLEDSWTVTWLRGEPLYLYCALRQLRSFPGFPVETAIDGGVAERRDLLMLIVANARIFGGGFRIAPGADLGDGRLDVMAFRNMGLFDRLGIMARLLRGTHAASPNVVASTASTLTLRFAEPPTYETDGEWNRAKAAEVRIETVPKALEVLAPGNGS